jgi:hypothetical protein
MEEHYTTLGAQRISGHSNTPMFGIMASTWQMFYQDSYPLRILLFYRSVLPGFLIPRTSRDVLKPPQSFYLINIGILAARKRSPHG